MTNNPDMQRKLRNHLLSRLPQIQDRPPDFEDLNAINTPYLEAVVHETLRMSRTAGGYSREGELPRKNALTFSHSGRRDSRQTCAKRHNCDLPDQYRE